MKSLLLAIFATVAAPAFAAGVISTSTVQKDDGFDMTKTNFTEFGLMMSSVNSGTMFADLTMGHNVTDWFTAMVRGLLPLDYSRATQVYGGQLVGRFNLINEVNTVYLEATLGGGMFAPQGQSTTSFGTIGADYGYSRRFSGDFTFGVNLGLDYSNHQVTRDQAVDTRTLFSHAALIGGYYF